MKSLLTEWRKFLAEENVEYQGILKISLFPSHDLGGRLISLSWSLNGFKILW